MSRPRLLVLVSAIAAVTLAAVLWSVWPRHDSGTTSGPAAGGAGGAGSGQGSSSATGPGATAGLPAGAVGSGCADYLSAVPTGPGSLAAMAHEPVAAAITASPLLRTFAAALSGGLNRQVDLEPDLARGPLTVFAPVDSAFARLSADRVDLLRRDAPRLRALLRAHLVAGRFDADRVVGAHRTAAGTTLHVTSGAAGLAVDGVPVVCGGVRTADATVYLLAEVLPAG